MRVSIDRNPALEGANITFTCADSGLTLVGPNSSVCLSNGQWEPDPREVECRGTEYYITYYTKHEHYR